MNRVSTGGIPDTHATRASASRDCDTRRFTRKYFRPLKTDWPREDAHFAPEHERNAVHTCNTPYTHKTRVARDGITKLEDTPARKSLPPSAPAVHTVSTFKEAVILKLLISRSIFSKELAFSRHQNKWVGKLCFYSFTVHDLFLICRLTHLFL